MSDLGGFMRAFTIAILAASGALSGMAAAQSATPVPATAQPATSAPVADDTRPNLSGTWQLDATHSDADRKLSTATWVIDESDNKIMLKQDEKSADGKDRKVEISCTTDGKDCPVPSTKDKASFWYNGPMLVVMEMRNNGDNIVRDRIHLSPDSKTMKVEVTSIVPKGDKPEELVFQKQ